MSSFLILALAGSALAVPFAGEHAHFRHREHNHFHGAIHHTGTGAPFALANATGIYGATGTAAGTGLPVASEYAAVASAYAPVGSDAAIVSSSCSRSTVYETQTNRVTLTVSRTAEAAEETSEYVAPLKVRQLAWEGKQRTWRRTTSTVVSTAAASSVVAASTSVSVAPASSSVAASSATSSAAAQTSASSGSGKRGVAYNDASLTTPFEGAAEVSWGYNWGQGSAGLSSSFNYVPLLWGTSSTYTSAWDASVKAAASAGSTHLMAFNEPDLSSQANLSPAAAAAAYKTYMQPYAGQFKLGAPAVTNGANGMGLDWLDAFITACDGCTIDFVSIHWYDSASNTEYFQDHVSNATSVAGGRPVWVTEFAPTSGTDAEISTFLETVMPWMDSQSFVERYAYFMVADGMLVSGGATSSYGSTYMSYTS